MRRVPLRRLPGPPLRRAPGCRGGEVWGAGCRGDIAPGEPGASVWGGHCAGRGETRGGEPLRSPYALPTRDPARPLYPPYALMLILIYPLCAWAGALGKIAPLYNILYSLMVALAGCVGAGILGV